MKKITLCLVMLFLMFVAHGQSSMIVRLGTEVIRENSLSDARDSFRQRGMPLEKFPSGKYGYMSEHPVLMAALEVENKKIKEVSFLGGAFIWFDIENSLETAGYEFEYSTDVNVGNGSVVLQDRYVYKNVVCCVQTLNRDMKQIVFSQRYTGAQYEKFLKEEEAQNNIALEREMALKAKEQERLKRKREEESKVLERIRSGESVNVSDQNIIAPEINVDLSKVITKYDKGQYIPFRGKNRESVVSIITGLDGKCNIISRKGALSQFVDTADIEIIENAKFKPALLDTIVPVSCKVNLVFKERLKPVGNLVVEAKYNKRKHCWNIEIIESKVRRFSVNPNVLNSYSGYENVAYSVGKELDYISENNDKLKKGKHYFDVQLYDHTISDAYYTRYSQPYTIVKEVVK